MTTTIRKNGNVENNGEIVGRVYAHPYGWESFPLLSTGQPRRFHGQRKWAVEVLVNDFQDAANKADPFSGWAERDGVFWAAFNADGERVGTFHNTRALAYAALTS